MVDLHTHTVCSDGTFTPTELVDYAAKLGLTAVAVTDHDTVAGIEEAVRHAKDLQICGLPSVKVVPGIEFSSEYEGRDIHIVGLFIDYKNAAFEKYLKDFVDSRDRRNEKMCKLLRERGCDITFTELQEENPGSVITRAHFAGLMLKKGYIRSMQEAFDKYIGDHGPCFVAREKVTVSDAVKLILEAGGIPVLAHPTLYHISRQNLEKLVEYLKKEGLMAIETKYSTYTNAEEREITEIKEKYHLLSSGGSDFHGENKAKIDLGTGYGSLSVPDEYLYKLEEALAKKCNTP
jgi:predicted metal-dependent phosphoesterase TrpH